MESPLHRPPAPRRVLSIDFSWHLICILVLNYSLGYLYYKNLISFYCHIIADTVGVPHMSLCCYHFGEQWPNVQLPAPALLCLWAFFHSCDSFAALWLATHGRELILRAPLNCNGWEGMGTVYISLALWDNTEVRFYPVPKVCLVELNSGHTQWDLASWHTFPWMLSFPPYFSTGESKSYPTPNFCSNLCIWICFWGNPK